MKGRRTRKQQLTAIAGIIVGVFAISIGFAAFSSTLNIRSSATVNPDASTFAVIFSKDGNSIDATQTVNPSSETYGDAATITNGTSPVIGGLKAKFTSPGQSVSYSFYAKNTGSYDAYLNYITFLNAEGATSNKICTAQAGTSQSLVDQACNGISISVKVGSDEAVTTSQSSIQNHTLATNTSEVVTVTISYAENAALADGAFEVSFGDVSLIYSSINNYVVEETPEETKVWTLTKAEGNTGEKAEIGDTITIKSENFYVYSNENGYIKAIAKYNLEVGNSTNSSYPATTETNLQSPNALGYKTGYDTYATVKYSSSSTDYVGSIIEGYVKTYKTKLESMGATFVDTLDDVEDPNDQQAGSGVRLITKKELEELGCSSSSNSCSGAPSFIYETTYWTGSAYSANDVWKVNSYGNFYNYGYSNVTKSGVRPIITILESSI